MVNLRSLYSKVCKGYLTQRESEPLSNYVWMTTGTKPIVYERTSGRELIVDYYYPDTPDILRAISLYSIKREAFK